MSKARTFDKYSLTERAKEGYDCFGRWIHVTGYANIVSFIIWHILDIIPLNPDELIEAKTGCIKRIGYVYTPKRVTCAMTLDEETKSMFERMYVAAGIDSFSAALDLVGQALPGSGPDVKYTNGFKNPFYLDESYGHVLIKAHGCKPLCDVSNFVFNDMNLLVCPSPDTYKIQVRLPSQTKSEPERRWRINTEAANSFADTLLEPSTNSSNSNELPVVDNLKLISTVPAEGVPKITVYSDKKGKIVAAASNTGSQTVIANSAKASKNAFFNADGLPRGKRGRNPFRNTPQVKS